MKIERILIATFLACLIALVVNVMTAVANWKAYYLQAELFVWMEQPQWRVFALAERERDMRQYRLPPLQPRQQQNRE